MSRKAETCRGPECSHPAHAVGLCNGHYQQHRKGQQLRPLKGLVSREGGCSRCGKPVTSRGLCRAHYDELRATLRLVEGGVPAERDVALLARRYVVQIVKAQGMDVEAMARFLGVATWVDGEVNPVVDRLDEAVDGLLKRLASE